MFFAFNVYIFSMQSQGEQSFFFVLSSFIYFRLLKQQQHQSLYISFSLLVFILSLKHLNDQRLNCLNLFSFELICDDFYLGQIASRLWEATVRVL